MPVAWPIWRLSLVHVALIPRAYVTPLYVIPGGDFYLELDLVDFKRKFLHRMNLVRLAVRKRASSMSLSILA